MKTFFRTLILRWLGIADHQERIKDLERHFVTKYTTEGAVAETLADVPVEKRKELKSGRTAGMSWPQRQKWLEATDGGTRAPVGMRLPSNS
jgi:hypothetical protein